MRTGIDMDDAEYVWPPSALTIERPQTGPEIQAERIEALEQRLAGAEAEINRLRDELEYKRRNGAL